MDFNFSDEQNMLREAARGFCEKMSPMGYVLEMEKDEKGYTEELWQGMANLGWMGLIIPEAYGGGGLKFLDMIVLLEEMGRMCVPGPFFSTTILGTLPILHAGSEEQKNDFLPKVASGELKLTLAYTEPGMTVYEPTHIEVSAALKGDSYCINGTKLFVPDAHVADHIVCLVRTNGSPMEKDGLTLLVADAKAAGITINCLNTLAGDKLCEVVFDNVMVPRRNLLGKEGGVWPIIEKVLQYAAVGTCAQMVGGAAKVLDLALDYAKQRVQFGKPIGAFQAVQHHFANMAIALQGSKFITYKAAWLLDEGLPSKRVTSAAKAWVSEAYKKFVILGHQIFAGTGFMEEHEMPMYSRRARAAELAFGDANYHRQVVAGEINL